MDYHRALSLYICLLTLIATCSAESATETTSFAPGSTTGEVTQTRVYTLSTRSSAETSKSVVTTTESETTASSGTTTGDISADSTTEQSHSTATVTKLLSSTVKKTSTTKSATTTEKQKKIDIELKFVGSATNWRQPKLRICIRCSAKKKILVKPQCYNVTDIQMTTNDTSAGIQSLNDYSWQVFRLHQGCEKVEFHWQGQWLVGSGRWGYVNHGSKVIADWRNEETASGQPMKHHIKLNKYQHCTGPLIIATAWQKTEILNVTCGPPSYTTETTAPSNSTEPAGVVPTGTRPPVTIVDKPTNPVVSISKKAFGEGPIIAIVVCSLAVIVAVFVVTVCGVRSFNNKRRRYRRDMNYDDLDTNSIAFENVPFSSRFNSRSESKIRLYSPLPDDAEDEENEHTVYSNMYTNTGEVEDVHHRSGGGVSTVYEDPRLKSPSSTSSDHPLAEL